MEDAWLTIIGIGEDGLAGLPEASRSALERAEIVFGGPRHLRLVRANGKGREWDEPFDIAPVLEARGRRVAVLAAGDPFWFGQGGLLTAQLQPGEWRALPTPGIFALTAARMGWRLEDCICLGLHDAPLARLRPHLSKGCRIIATLRDEAAPLGLARWLTAQNMGAMGMAVLESLGGPQERVRFTRAGTFGATGGAAPVAVALDGDELPRDVGLSTVPGRPQALFAHDGHIAKSPIRAITLSALAPRGREILWDIGAGSGSISVEWALAGGRAYAVEPHPGRQQNILANIAGFGMGDQIAMCAGAAPDALDGLPEPDAVHIGGCGSPELLEAVWDRLPPGVRIVANATRLDTESALADLQARHGGKLMRFETSEVGGHAEARRWQAGQPVVQWRVTR